MNCRKSPISITLVSIILLFVFVNISKSQTDTILIKLKNNQIDKIALTQIKKIQFENVTGVEDNNNASSNLKTNGNYPNPFQTQTNIEFEIGQAGNVEVYIFDNSGNQIQKLECGNCSAGKNVLNWNGLDKNNKLVQSGTYFYEVRFNNEVQSKKMILIK